MQLRLQHLIFAALVISLVSLAYGFNYKYFSDTELTVFGEHLRFMQSDTGGGTRTNECLSFQGVQPVVGRNDFVILGGHCPTWHAAYHVIRNAPELPFPETATWIRQQAQRRGYYFSRGPNMQARIRLELSSMRVWWWQEGTPFDSSISSSLLVLPDSAIVFFDTQHLQLSGMVTTTLILGAAGQVGLEDNIVYASSTGQWGQIAPNHPEKFALVAEGNIKILNTPANGREDSHGMGLSQTNPNFTSIALNGAYFALGESFTFDQQNDADSSYVYQNPPGTNHRDDRGTIYLWGSLAQKRRGYVHRATPQPAYPYPSTGYQTQYHVDEQLKFWNAGVFEAQENVIEPGSVNFGSIPAGRTVYDTVTVSNDFVPISIDSMHIPSQFFAVAPDSYRWEQSLAVAFSPVHAGTFRDTIRFYLAYYHRWYDIPVRGTATVAAAESDFISPPASFSLSAFPNPFNPTTRIAFTVPRAGKVRLDAFDLLGGRVSTLQDGMMNAGEHTVQFNGSALPSGVYFIRLESADFFKTEKLLLLK